MAVVWHLTDLGRIPSAAGVATRGYAAGRRITYLDNGVTVRDAGVDTNFSLMQGNLSLTRIAARLLGGGVTGDAEIKKSPLGYNQCRCAHDCTGHSTRETER